MGMTLQMLAEGALSGWVEAILTVLTVIVAVLMTFFILLQEGKGGGLAALGGTKAAGVEGVTNPIRRATGWLAGIMFVLLVLLAVMRKPAETINAFGDKQASADAIETGTNTQMNANVGPAVVPPVINVNPGNAPAPVPAPAPEVKKDATAVTATSTAIGNSTDTKTDGAKLDSGKTPAPPVEAAKPADVAKPVEAAKPVEPAKPDALKADAPKDEAHKVEAPPVVKPEEAKK